MTRVLLTAFEPYEPWSTNASWLALVELLRDLQTTMELTTRLYPVDLTAMKDKLASDMKSQYDVAIHIGQAPGSTCLQFEEFAVNLAVAGKTLTHHAAAVAIDEAGPVAYRSQLPLQAYAASLRESGIPARVSQHAGTFLCNAILYWSHQLIADLRLTTKATFLHIPLETSQVLELDDPTAFMPKEMVASGLRLILEQLELVHEETAA